MKRTPKRRMDEMERQILFQAQRNAYLFLGAALFAWSLYEACQLCLYHRWPHPMPYLLLGAAALVQTTSRLVLTRRAVREDEDSYETGPLARLVLLACGTACLAAAAAGGAALLWVRL